MRKKLFHLKFNTKQILLNNEMNSAPVLYSHKNEKKSTQNDVKYIKVSLNRTNSKNLHFEPVFTATS